MMFLEMKETWSENAKVTRRLHLPCPVPTFNLFKSCTHFQLPTSNIVGDAVICAAKNERSKLLSRLVRSSVKSN